MLKVPCLLYLNQDPSKHQMHEEAGSNLRISHLIIMEKLIIFVADQIALSEDENGFLHLLLGPDRTEVLGVTLVQVAELVNQFNLAQGSTALFQLGSDEANMRYLLKFLHKVPELEFSTSVLPLALSPYLIYG